MLTENAFDIKRNHRFGKLNKGAKISVVSIFLLGSIIAYWNFFVNAIYMSDCVDWSMFPLENNCAFLKSGRYIGYLTNLALIKSPINTATSSYRQISMLFGIIFFSVAAYLIVILFSKAIQKTSRWDIRGVLITAVLICPVIVNPYMLEYIEFSVWTYLYGLACLFAVIAAYCFYEERYIWFIITCSVSSCLYQSFAGLTIICVLLANYFSCNGNLNKNIFQKSVSIFTTVGLMSLLNILSIKILVKTGIVGAAAKQAMKITDITRNIYGAGHALYSMLKSYSGLTMVLYWPMLIMLCLLVLVLLGKRRNIYQWGYLLLLAVAVFFSAYMPVIGNTTGYAAPRIVEVSNAFFSVLMLIAYFDTDSLKIKKMTVLICSLYMGIVIININNIADDAIKNIHIEESTATEVIRMIDEYEEKNNTNITTIVVCKDLNPTQYSSSVKRATYNVNARILYDSWGDVNMINYIGHTDYRRETVENIGYDLPAEFNNKDWISFSEEQLVFKDNVLYWCLY